MHKCYHETPLTFIEKHIHNISIVVVNIEIDNKLRKHNCKEEVPYHLQVVFVEKAPKTFVKMGAVKVF